jgi:RHS repeat-associated protein
LQEEESLGRASYLLGDGPTQRFARLTGIPSDAPDGKGNGSGDGFFVQDRRGNIAEVEDIKLGNSLAKYSYDGFGNTTSAQTATVNTRQTTRNGFGFTGLRQGPGGTTQAHWRSYDSTSGTWQQEDPISFSAGDANIRRYVGNDPVNYTDVSGLEEKPIRTPVIQAWNPSDNDLRKHLREAEFDRRLRLQGYSDEYIRNAIAQARGQYWDTEDIYPDARERGDSPFWAGMQTIFNPGSGYLDQFGPAMGGFAPVAGSATRPYPSTTLGSTRVPVSIKTPGTLPNSKPPGLPNPNQKPSYRFTPTDHLEAY